MSPERQRAQREAEEEAAAITEEDRGRIEIVAKESENRSAEQDRDQHYFLVAVDQRGGDQRYQGEKRRSCRKAVESIDQVEGIRDPEHP